MPLQNTEKLHEFAKGLDERPLGEAARILAQGQIDAAESLLNASSALMDAGLRMAETIRSGGRLYYVAAGSSGLMAAADAMELGGTFDIPSSQVRIIMAGGLPSSAEMPGGTEDETAELSAGLAELQAIDTIIAVSASGTTPFTIEAAVIARAKGAKLIGIANNPDTTLLEAADIPVLVATPPEVIAGSTRMGAGTAQKIALNIMSSLMAIDLGLIHDGMMVNVRAENIKLRIRAQRIVSTIAEINEEEAGKFLDAADGDIKQAVLMADGSSLAEAKAQLADAKGNLRVALSR